MKESVRYAISIVILYIVLWWAGAWFDFFPFHGSETGYTGLLIVIVSVVCAYWAIDTIQKKTDAVSEERPSAGDGTEDISDQTSEKAEPGQ